MQYLFMIKILRGRNGNKVAHKRFYFISLELQKCSLSTDKKKYHSTLSHDFKVKIFYLVKIEYALHFFRTGQVIVPILF